MDACIISKKSINTERQTEIDWLKIFAIFFMVIIHVYEELSIINHDIMPDSAFRIIIEFLGGPLAAPVFMFSMGIGMVYTKNASAEAFAKRGIKLLVLGYLSIQSKVLQCVLGLFFYTNASISSFPMFY